MVAFAHGPTAALNLRLLFLLHTEPEHYPCRNPSCLQQSRKKSNVDLLYFVDEPPSVAQGGRGVVVAGCPACRIRINTIPEFLEHLSKDAMNRLSENST
jgi:hypothetical protein